ncbi:MAG: PAS domain S-box protein [Anaerolineae bacterium]|nr:PAS domain S-box protein [Anaerolineae bacterium]
MQGQARPRILGTILPIVMPYAVGASLWIIGSDQLVALIFPSTAETTLAQTLKGLIFVGVTSALLLGLAYHQVHRRVSQERQTQAQDRAYRDLLDTSPDFIARFDRQLRHLFVNRALLETVGLSREQYIGKTNRDLGMPEDQLAIWDPALKQVLRQPSRTT